MKCTFISDCHIPKNLSLWKRIQLFFIGEKRIDV